jgi:hypothetical protein
MSFHRIRGPVSFTSGVEVRASGGSIHSATISDFMHVESSSSGREVMEVDLNFDQLPFLDKAHGTLGYSLPHGA